VIILKAFANNRFYIYIYIFSFSDNFFLLVLYKNHAIHVSTLRSYVGDVYSIEFTRQAERNSGVADELPTFVRTILEKCRRCNFPKKREQNRRVLFSGHAKEIRRIVVTLTSRSPLYLTPTNSAQRLVVEALLGVLFSPSFSVKFYRKRFFSPSD